MRRRQISNKTKEIIDQLSRNKNPITNLDISPDMLVRIVSNEWYRQEDIAKIAESIVLEYGYDFKTQFEVVGSIEQLKAFLDKENSYKENIKFVIYNKGRNHWVNICVIASGGGTVLYKDSLGDLMPIEIKTYLAERFGTDLNIKMHLVTEQCDKHNCGSISLLNLKILMSSLKDQPEQFIKDFENTKFSTQDEVIDFKKSLKNEFLSKWIIELSQNELFKLDLNSFIRNMPFIDPKEFKSTTDQLLGATKQMSTLHLQKGLLETIGSEGVFSSVQDLVENNPLIVSLEEFLSLKKQLGKVLSSATIDISLAKDLISKILVPLKYLDKIQDLKTLSNDLQSLNLQEFKETLKHKLKTKLGELLEPFKNHEQITKLKNLADNLPDLQDLSRLSEGENNLIKSLLEGQLDGESISSIAQGIFKSIRHLDKDQWIPYLEEKQKLLSELLKKTGIKSESIQINFQEKLSTLLVQLLKDKLPQLNSLSTDAIKEIVQGGMTALKYANQVKGLVNLAKKLPIFDSIGPDNLAEIFKNELPAISLAEDISSRACEGLPQISKLNTLLKQIPDFSTKDIIDNGNQLIDSLENGTSHKDLTENFIKKLSLITSNSLVQINNLKEFVQDSSVIDAMNLVSSSQKLIKILDSNLVGSQNINKMFSSFGLVEKCKKQAFQTVKPLIDKIKVLGLENIQWVIDENGIKGIDFTYFTTILQNLVQNSVVDSGTKYLALLASNYIPDLGEIAYTASVGATEAVKNYAKGKINEGIHNLQQKFSVHIFGQDGKLDSYLNIANKFPGEWDKFNTIFDLLSTSEINENFDQVLSQLGNNLNLSNQEIKTLKTLFVEKRESIEKKCNSASWSRGGDKQEEANIIQVTEPRNSIFEKESSTKELQAHNAIKSLDELLEEIQLLSEAEKLSLREGYNKVKAYYDHWKDKAEVEIKAWISSKKGHLNGGEIYEAIAIMDRANEIVTEIATGKAHHLRDTQILSVLTFLSTTEGKGKLCQISTGEGKTTIVSLLATIKVLQGEKIDVITSSPVLAEEGVKDKGNFYKILGLSVATNNPTEMYLNGAKECYNSDIVYGSISNFQFDYLKDSFLGLGTRGNRGFGTVVLDEVDSMIIDNAGHIAKLSGPFPGMENFRYIYIKIWQELAKAEEELVKQYQTQDSAEDQHMIESMRTNLKNHVKQMLEKEFSDDFNNNPDSAQTGCNLIKMIPIHLRDYAKGKIDTWIDYAINAKYVCNENQQYIVGEKDGEEWITPLDYANTGVSLKNTVWSHGLHQFLQLKHNLHLTTESLTSSFISNLGYINKYVSTSNANDSDKKVTKIFGLTGTLGSESEQDLLSSIYSVTYAIIPTYKQKNFQKLPSLIVEDDALAQIATLETLKQIDQDRAVLIICETIADLLNIQKQLKILQNYEKSNFRIKVFAHEDDSAVTEEMLEPGDVVIATNIAGRGTDFKTSIDLKNNGGLHIITAFFPCNKRVHDQADGRTARQGDPGTAQSIIRESEVKKLGLEVTRLSNDNYDTELEARRGQIEAERLDNIKQSRVKELNYQDGMFSKFAKKFTTLKKANEQTEDFYNVLEDLKECWAFWLEKRNLERDKLKAKSPENDEEHNIAKDFKEFEEYAKEIINGKICWNPYYSIRQAKSFLKEVNKLDNAEASIKNAIESAGNSEILYSAHMVSFEISIKRGNALLERFKDIISKVAVFGYFTEVKDNNYICNAKIALERAKNCLEVEINYIHKLLFMNNPDTNSISNLVYSQDFKNILVSRPQGLISQENILVKHLVSRLAILTTYYHNTESILVEQLANYTYKDGVIIQKKINNYFKELSPGENSAAITDKEVQELRYVGLDAIYSLSKVRDVEPLIIQAAQGQIGSGLALLAGAAFFPPLLIVNAPIAGALISEGVCDIVIELIKFEGEEFNHTEYTKSKLISYGISIGTMGIGPLVTATKTLTKSLKVCQKMSGAFRKSPFMKNICSKVATKLNKIEKLPLAKITSHTEHLDDIITISKTIKSIGLETTTAVASSILIDKVVQPILKDSLQGLETKIREEVEKILRKDSKLKEKVSLLEEDTVLSTASGIINNDLQEIITDIAREIAIGIATSSRNWKIKVTANIIDAIDLTGGFSSYPTTFCEKMKVQLSEPTNQPEVIDLEKQDQIERTLKTLIDQVSTSIYSRLVGFGCKLASTYVITPGIDKLTALGGKDKKTQKSLADEERSNSKIALDNKHLETLGLKEGATPGDIKQAYKDLSRIHHPDKGGDTVRFQQIADAKEHLLSMTEAQARRAMREDIIFSNKSAKQNEIYEMAFPPKIKVKNTSDGILTDKSLNRQFDIFDAKAIANAEQYSIRIFDSKGSLIKQYGKKYAGNKDSIELTYWQATEDKPGHYEPKDPVKKAQVEKTGSNNCGFDSLAVFLRKNTADLIAVADSNKSYCGKFIRKIGIANDKILKGGSLIDHLEIQIPEYFGGSYGALRKEFAGMQKGHTEINHIPPKDAYKGTPYQDVHMNNMPAIVMDLEDHRNSKGGIGSASSTGSGSIAKKYRENLKQKLNEGRYWEALRDDCQDTLNITAGKNPSCYAKHIKEMLNYLKDNDIPGAPEIEGVPKGRLISETQYYQIIQDLRLDKLIATPNNPTGQGVEVYDNATYWNEYSKIGLNDLLQLRLENLGIKEVKIVIPKRVWDKTTSAANSLIAEIMNTLTAEEETVLIPLNLYARHWVGLIVEKEIDHIKLTYIDSENSPAPRRLLTSIQEALVKLDYEIEFNQPKIEEQYSNNCGPEVIENFIFYLTGSRLSQAEAVIYHSYLLEGRLLSENVDNQENFVTYQSVDYLGESEFYDQNSIMVPEI